MKSATAASSQPDTAEATGRRATRRVNWREVGVGLACLGVGALALVLTATISTDGGASARFSPRWWPDILSWTLIALSLVQIIVSVRTPVSSPDDTPALRFPIADGFRLAGVVGLTVAFLVLWWYVDFRISAALYLAGIGFVLGSRRWWELTLVPASTAMLIYLVFHDLFRVPL